MAYNVSHELSDGSFWTSKEVAESTGINITTIRCRLARTKDVNIVFAPKLQTSPKGGHYKQYKLTDGTLWTVPEVAAYIDASSTTAGARLWRSKDPAVVLAPVLTQKGRAGIKLSKDILDRMYFADRDWWLTFGRGT